MENILDPKLLSHLNHSNQVQSQLKLSIQQYSDPLSQSIFRKPALFHSLSAPTAPPDVATEETDSKRTDGSSNERLVREHLLMLMKLFDETRVMNVMRSFLTYDAYQVILASYKARKRQSKAAQNPKGNQPSSKLRIFQDNLLYTGYYSKINEDREDAVEIRDVDLLRFDIEQFTQERDALLRDNKRCAYFLQDPHSSEALQYRYLALKLQYARQCANSSKNQGMAGQYLSKLLDLRNEVLSQCKEQRPKLALSLDNLLRCRQELKEDLFEFAAHLHDVEKQTAASDEQVKIDLSVRENKYSDEEKLQLFDERLQRIAQLLKPPQFSTNTATLSPFKKSFSSKDKQLSNDFEEQGNTEEESALTSSSSSSSSSSADSKKLVDIMTANTSSELTAFHLEAQARMESCYQMTLRSLKRRDANREAILSASSDASTEKRRFRDRLIDLSDKVKDHEELISSATSFREERREEFLRRFEEDIARPSALVAESRSKFAERLKEEYGNLLAQTQNKAKMSSFR